jgi:putative tricarboxylic transport membrane protein
VISHTNGLWVVLLLGLSLPLAAERLHLVIPAGPGGGLDATARALGNTLTESQLLQSVSFENRSGGGGGKAMAYFVNSGDSLENTLLVNSAPLIVRSLQGLFPHSYRDLTPIGGLIADPGVIAVRANSSMSSWGDVVAALGDSRKRLFVGGGSVKGSLDHITLSLLAQAGGIDPRKVRYLAYDGGAKALLALMSGEVDVLVSGLGETLAAHQAGTIRILGVTGDSGHQQAGIASFTEQDVEVVFYNWRGVFAPRNIEPADQQRLVELLTKAVATPTWQKQLDRYGWQTKFLPDQLFVEYLQEQERQLQAVMTDLGLMRR